MLICYNSFMDIKEIKTVQYVGAGGTFTLTFPDIQHYLWKGKPVRRRVSRTTKPIPFDADEKVIQAAIEAARLPKSTTQINVAKHEHSCVKTISFQIGEN
jgi:hypothetical protein